MPEIIGVARLIKLCEAKMLTKERTASEIGALREKIGDAVENQHLHAQAFAVASKYFAMRKKDELKGKEFAEQLRVYLDALDDNWPDEEHVGDFDRDAQAKEAKEKHVESNVRALRGIRKPKQGELETAAPESVPAE